MRITANDFWEVMLAFRVVDPVTGCWRWLGDTDVAGYASLYVDRRPVRFHEWSYRWHLGEPMPGYTVVQRCGNPTCGNPDHLKAVPPSVAGVLAAAPLAA